MTHIYVPSLIVINTTINWIRTNVSLIAIYYLRLFVVFQPVAGSDVIGGKKCVPSFIVISTASSRLMYH